MDKLVKNLLRLAELTSLVDKNMEETAKVEADLERIKKDSTEVISAIRSVDRDRTDYRQSAALFMVASNLKVQAQICHTKFEKLNEEFVRLTIEIEDLRKELEEEA